MEKIDVHCHVTKRKLNGVVSEVANIDKVLIEMKKYDIEKSVLLASYFPHKGSGVSNFRMLDWINGRDEFYLFGSLDFKNYFYQGYNELVELTNSNRLNGIKIYSTYQEIDLNGEKLTKVLELAGKNNLPVMFNTGCSYSALREIGRDFVYEMVTAENLEFIVRRQEEINFIFSHMSKPYFDGLKSVTGKYKNAYTDMSGLINSAEDREDIPGNVEEIRKFLYECGPDKLLFGTDFP